MREFRMLAAMMLLAGGLMGFSCDPEGVGDPCVPEDEYDQAFSGFSVEQVNVESRSFSCVTRICLVNHFQGRVSCPYGQSEKQADFCQGRVDAAGNPLDPAVTPPASCGQVDSADYKQSCRKPGANGEDATDRIDLEVPAQLKDRQADKAVYCSCRCDGPDAGARYCECPDGFSCESLVEDIGLGKGQLAGSYCVKSGTKFDPLTDSGGATCDNRNDPKGTCGSEGSNPPLL